MHTKYNNSFPRFSKWWPHCINSVSRFDLTKQGNKLVKQFVNSWSRLYIFFPACHARGTVQYLKNIMPQKLSIEPRIFHKKERNLSIPIHDCKVLIKNNWKTSPSLDTLEVWCPWAYSYYDCTFAICSKQKWSWSSCELCVSLYRLPVETRSNVRVYTLEWTQKRSQQGLALFWIEMKLKLTGYEDRMNLCHIKMFQDRFELNDGKTGQFVLILYINMNEIWELWWRVRFLAIKMA